MQKVETHLICVLTYSSKFEFFSQTWLMSGGFAEQYNLLRYSTILPTLPQPDFIAQLCESRQQNMALKYVDLLIICMQI